MSQLRVLIAEDEAVARRRLRRLLGVLPGVRLVGEVADGVELLAQLREGGVDLVLLDIHMPRMSGLEALALMELDGPAIVFTTAYAEHAVQAFEHDAVDYLLKPIDQERLAQALERVARRRAEGAPTGAATVGLPGRLVVPTRRGLVMLPVEDVTHAVLDGVSCIVHTREASYITDFRLSELERRLPAGRFRRVHRQALVDLACIERLEPTPSGGYEAHLHGGQQVPISRQEARRLRKEWKLPS